MERDAETAPPPIKLTIVRSRWARGGASGPSRMLNDHGSMCCLGFLGRACGYSDTALYRRTDPGAVVRATAAGVKIGEMFAADARCSFPEGLLNEEDCLTCAGYSLIGVNDNPTLTEDVREESIGRLMAEIGVEVSFVD